MKYMPSLRRTSAELGSEAVSGTILADDEAKGNGVELRPDVDLTCDILSTFLKLP